MPISARPASTAQRLLPVLGWLPSYQRAWLLPDVLAGLAVWAVMVPEGMAYAGIVGVPPIMGLYTIVPPLSRLRVAWYLAFAGGRPRYRDGVDLCLDRRSHRCPGNPGLSIRLHRPLRS